MKKLMILSVISFGMFQVQAQEKVNVKSGSSVELSYDEFETSTVELKNASMKSFDVKVEDANSKEWVKGFGLGPMGKAFVDVQPGQVLIFENNSDKDIAVNVDFVDRVAKKEVKVSSTMITFTLHNSSGKSIPLVIPSVMNPNLSPFSDSGVKLKVGQNIYYRKGGKKKLLLTVDASIENGDKIDVAKRIEKLEKK